VWDANRDDLLKINLGKERVEKFVEFKKNFDAGSYFLRMEKMGISAVTYDEKNYPENLKNIKDPPQVLYVRGTLKESDSILIAIVGSRKMTSYGKNVCEQFGRDLVACGITIVSGLALGIDSVAHRIAVESGGRTIAVIGGGVDKIYPSSNTRLADSIVGNGGAVISEYPLGYPSKPENFPARNRIVSGISLGVVIIEGSQKSGTLLTASHAADQGREVFAVPGPINSPNSQAPHFLIKNGAKLVTSASEIIEELDIKAKITKSNARKILPEGKDEIFLLELLSREPLHLDELVRLSNMRTGEVMSLITGLELKGLIKNSGNGIYEKV